VSPPPWLPALGAVQELQLGSASPATAGGFALAPPSPCAVLIPDTFPSLLLFTRPSVLPESFREKGHYFLKATEIEVQVPPSPSLPSPLL